MKSLLLIDDFVTAEIITFYLGREGFETVTFQNRQSILEHLRSEVPDLVTVDSNCLADGTSGLCVDIRNISDVPLIILCSSTEENEIIRGLQLGADDYIVKPFSPRLMMARIHALLRRAGPLKPMVAEEIEFGGLTLDRTRRQIRRDGARVARLTRQECRLLEILIRNSHHVLTAELLINHVWGSDGGDVLTLKALLARLRRKLAMDPLTAVSIETQRGVGYRLVTAMPAGVEPMRQAEPRTSGS